MTEGQLSQLKHRHPQQCPNSHTGVEPQETFSSPAVNPAEQLALVGTVHRPTVVPVPVLNPPLSKQGALSWGKSTLSGPFSQEATHIAMTVDCVACGSLGPGCGPSRGYALIMAHTVQSSGCWRQKQGS